MGICAGREGRFGCKSCSQEMQAASDVTSATR